MNQPNQPVQVFRVIKNTKGNKEAEDVASGRVAGANNLTGQLIAAEGYGEGTTTYTSSNTNADRTAGAISTSTVVTVNRAKSRKARSVQFQSFSSSSVSAGDIAGTNASTNNPDCEQPSANPDNPNPPEPDPPPSPPEPPSNGGGGNGEEQTPDPSEPGSQPYGCGPTDDAQWYNAPNGDASNCPSGTVYLGFAELPGGNFKVLCEGASRPPGDGCPTQPTDSYNCVNGVCIPVEGGQYATLEECQGNCASPQLYICNNGTCEPSSDGEAPPGARLFSSLEACQANCIPGEVGYNCADGNCVEVPNGVYATLAECQSSGCGCQPGNIDGVIYQYRVTKNNPFGAPIVENTAGFQKPYSFEIACCLGSLGSQADGIYGTWVDVDGISRGPAFLYGPCASYVGGSGSSCGWNFYITSIEIIRQDGTEECS